MVRTAVERHDTWFYHPLLQWTGGTGAQTGPSSPNVRVPGGGGGHNYTEPAEGFYYFYSGN